MSRPQPAARTAPPPAPPATQRTSKMAIWSLVLSILWLGGLGSVAGILLGVSARRRIAGTGERGAGLAVAGIVIGVITLLFAVAYWAVIAMHTGGSGGGGGGGGGTDHRCRRPGGRGRRRSPVPACRREAHEFVEAGPAGCGADVRLDRA